MIEFTTLVTLCVLYLVFFRNGKTPALKSPLVVERPGQYHLTLAPQLNLAQPYIESIGSRLMSDEIKPDSATQFYEVRDKQVAAHGFDFYLLAITRRNGMLYFQAARPTSKNEAGKLPAIREFSDAVLMKIQGGEQPVPGEDIVAAVQQEANLRGVQIKTLEG